MSDVGRIRSAASADLDALYNCDPFAARGDSARRAKIAKAVEFRQCVVWDEMGETLGFLLTLPNHFFGRDFVELLVVTPSHRRRGIARSLLGSAVASSSEQVWTSTNASNLPMRTLLTNDGWHFAGTLNGLDEGDPEMFFYFQVLPPN